MKKYYIGDLSFYYALNTDNRINYGPVLENIVFFMQEVWVKAANLPAMIYYGVNSDEAILMGMNNVPRSAAKEKNDGQ